MNKYNNLGKNPLGVKPKEIWLEERILDLSRAIYEYLNEYGNFNSNNIIAWVTELKQLLEERMRDL